MNINEILSLFEFVYGSLNLAIEVCVYISCCTFNLANMYQGQTTRVIFKATYAPKNDAGKSLAEEDGTFYTIGNMTTILKKADLETAVNTAATSVLPGCTVNYANLETEGSHVITLEDIKDGTSRSRNDLWHKDR